MARLIGETVASLSSFFCFSVMWGLRNWNLHYQHFCCEGSWCDAVYPIRLEHGRRHKSHSFVTAALTVLEFGQEGPGIVCSYFSWRAIIEGIVSSHQVLRISGKQSSGVGNVDLISQSPYYWHRRKKEEWPAEVSTVRLSKPVPVSCQVCDPRGRVWWIVSSGFLDRR